MLNNVTQSISIRLIRTIVIFALCIGMLLSSVQIYLDFLDAKADLTSTVQKISKATLPPATRAAHFLDAGLATEVVNGLIEYDFIIEATIFDDLNQTLASSQSPPQVSNTREVTSSITEVTREFHIQLHSSDSEDSAGYLHIVADQDQWFSNFYDRAIIVFVSGVVRNVLLSIVLLILCYILITKPVVSLAEALGRVQPDEFGFGEIRLPRRNKGDELDLVIDTINSIQTQLKDDIQRRLQTEDKIHSLIEALPDVTFVLDEEGRYIEILTKQENLLYVESQKLRGKLIRDILPQEVANLVLQTIHQTLETKENQIIEYELDIPSGSTWFEGRTSHMTQLFNGKRAVVWVARDISQQKRIELQLRQSQKMEALGTLAGGIAHDFNNILMMISMNMEMTMQVTPKHSEAMPYLEAISNASHRASSLVKQILTFSRMESSELEPIDLVSVVQDSLDMVETTLPTNITLQRDFAENCRHILANVTQIHQIIINLSSNAFHSMEESGGTIKITIRELAQGSPLEGRRHHPAILLNVTDSGKGISSQDQGRIFDPFFTTKEVGHGTGLGLSVVHGIVEKHQGKITIESEIGKGTSISIFFPVTTKGNAQQSEQEAALTSGTGRILFVEDEVEIRRVMQHFLQKQGYVVTNCENGSDALDLFQKEPDQFDLVLTDHTMPQMTGKQLAQKILKIRPNLPIILMSGYSGAATEEMVKELGIHSYLMKPIRLATLQKTIEDALA